MLIRRLRYWLDSAKREAQLRADMELHIEERAAALRESGWNERDSLAEARRRFGNVGLKQEEAREIWIARYWSEFCQDLRYAARTLAAQPAFLTATVLALVLGIGVNAILFNVYNALALAPWAVRDAEHTVQVLAEDRGGRWGGFSWPHYVYLRAHTQTLAGIVGFNELRTRITQGETSWSAVTVTASEDYFDVIGTGFAYGRGFSPEAGVLRDTAPEVVMNYDTWINHFGADPAIVGTWLDISGHALQVVGVAARGFNGPAPNRMDLWVPGAWADIFDPGRVSFGDANSCCISVVGRLKPETPRASAQAELHTLTRQFLASVKREPSRILLTDPAFLANPSRFGKVSALFLAVGVASFLILLLACANVANLQLARAVARRREIAVRLSLGAGRARIFRQLMVESLLISSIAGALSVGVSAWVPGWTIRTLAGPTEPLSIRFANDLRVLGFILLATFIAAVLFGFAPAWNVIRDSAATGLRVGGRATSSSRTRAFLLAAQVALCAILLSGTALLVRALDHVRHVDPGFRYEKVIVLSTGLDSSGVNDQTVRGLLASLEERIAGLPGVESVARATIVHFGNVQNFTSVPDPRTNENVMVGINEVSANFFDTLTIPVLSGRSFNAADEGRRDTVIVNDAAAQRLWPGESPLGKTLIVGQPLEVVGVVRNFGTRGFGSEQEPYIWTPSAGSIRTALLVQYSGDSGPLMTVLAKRAREIDRRFFVTASPYTETMDRAKRVASVSAAVAAVLGMLSLVLACVGIYGVAAYNVSQRTREVGVRMALGAQPSAILAMIVSQNLRTVCLGAAVGIAGAVTFGRLLRSLLYGVEPTDPGAIASAIAILAATSALATWGPAHRASRVDPAVTLRED